MAKAKKKSSSATIGFEQQIWDAACELWGHIPAADYRKIFTGLIFLKYISTAFEKKIRRTPCRRRRIWRRPGCLRSRQYLLRPARSPLVRNCKGSPHTGNRHNLRQSHDCHRSRQQKPQRRPSKKLRKTQNWTNASLVT